MELCVLPKLFKSSNEICCEQLASTRPNTLFNLCFRQISNIEFNCRTQSIIHTKGSALIKRYISSYVHIKTRQHTRSFFHEKASRMYKFILCNAEEILLNIRLYKNICSSIIESPESGFITFSKNF